MVDGQGIPILDRWTERTADDLWALGDEVDVDIEFAPWDEGSKIEHHENYTTGYHRWTDGSRRVSAAFGWPLRSYNTGQNPRAGAQSRMLWRI
jgi:hypothetical protein